MNASGLYGLIAEFEDPNALIAATQLSFRRLRCATNTENGTALAARC
jgi:hypothetical protein